MNINFVWIFLTIALVQVNTEKSNPCPPGVRPVQCFVNPCRIKTCPANPSAKCTPNYCGGCNTIWIGSDGRQVQCDRKSVCPPGQNIVQCFKDPCQGETCPGDSSARCISNYCGGCNFSWKKPNGKPARCS